MSTTSIKTFKETPYHDDYFTLDSNNQTVETKNYHRILFRPGYAVQARELTQMQTMLQAQIDRLQTQLNELNDLKEMFRLPKPQNKDRKLFDEQE